MVSSFLFRLDCIQPTLMKYFGIVDGTWRVVTDPIIPDRVSFIP